MYVYARCASRITIFSRLTTKRTVVILLSVSQLTYAVEGEDEAADVFENPLVGQIEAEGFLRDGTGNLDDLPLDGEYLLQIPVEHLGKAQQADRGFGRSAVEDDKVISPFPIVSLDEEEAEKLLHAGEY